jgi:hypothetical protein
MPTISPCRMSLKALCKLGGSWVIADWKSGGVGAIRLGEVRMVCVFCGEDVLYFREGFPCCACNSECAGSRCIDAEEGRGVAWVDDGESVDIACGMMDLSVGGIDCLEGASGGLFNGTVAVKPCFKASSQCSISVKKRFFLPILVMY